MNKFYLIIFFLFTFCSFIRAQTTNIISQYGIAWHFDQQYEFGQFANGDYWIAGSKVIITRVTPDFDSVGGEYINGWEINPSVEGPQGFASVAGNFDISLVPSLPCTLTTSASVVKTIRSDRSGDPAYESLSTASVLTVLIDSPPENGEKLFRPPYVGDDKRFYHIDSLKTNLLPSLPPVNEAKTLEWTIENFKRVQLDHKEGAVGRYLHPIENIPDYGASIGIRNADGALSLFLNDPIEAKMEGLIAYVQYGIDLYHMMKLGHTWPAGGGHRPGQKLPLSFAAVLLDNNSMKTMIKNHEFHEDRGLELANDGRTVLYGFKDYDDQAKNFERDYWECVVYHVVAGNARGFKSFPDPYGFIDGGPEPGTAYQYCCTSQPWKGTVLCCYLMPELQEMWVGEDSLLFNYVDRWVVNGIHSQPDPCAPPPKISDGEEMLEDRTVFNEYMDENYGETFGPNSSNLGGCIYDVDSSDGIGRFPELHNTKVDGGGHRSYFVDEMWNEYHGTDDYPPIVENPISTVKVDMNAPNETIDLTYVFTDPDNDDSNITKSVFNNDNETLVSTSIDDETLILNFQEDHSGTANIVIEAVSNYKTVRDTFIVTVNEVTTIIENEQSATNKYFLGNNYPNPFYSFTTFEYGLSERSDVQISIYNMIGNVVETVNYNAQKQGVHSFQWDATGISPGIYFYVIKTRNFTDTKKCILKE